MKNRLSRLSRFEEKKVYRRILLSILATVILFLSVIFLGVPALVKFSLFLGSLHGTSETSQQQDNTPPFAPRLEAPYTATNSARITITGYAEASTTLEVFLNNRSLKKILLGKDGQISLPNITLDEGDNKITAISKDTAGNTSQPSDPLTIVYKNKVPVLEINDPQEGQTFSGDNKQITINGITDVGATVTINNRLVLVNDDGSFSYPVSLNNGDNTFNIVSIDIAGNQTTVERKVTFNP